MDVEAGADAGCHRGGHGALQSAQNELRWLELTKKRYEQAVAEACTQYTTLNSEKDALETKKGEARDRLDTYSATVCETYRKAINNAVCSKAQQGNGVISTIRDVVTTDILGDDQAKKDKQKGS